MVYVHDNRHFVDEGINVSSPLWILRIAILREYKEENVQSSLISHLFDMIAKILESIHIEFELRGKKNIIIEEIFKIFGIGEKYLSRRKGKKEKYSEKKK